MKKFILFSIIALSFVITGSFAQTAPKKEFTVSMSEKDINLASGESKTIDITINRSKAYKKAKIELALGSTIPEGITIDFKNGIDPLTQRKMILTASESVGNISKTLVLKAKSSRVSKGVMFKLNTNVTAISAN